MRSTKWLFGIGLVVQSLLCLLAWITVKERMVLPDSASYLFGMLIHRTGFAVFHNRFIAVPTQLLPWIGIQCSASLGTVARLYSLNLELFHAACFLICGYVFRNYRLAVACLLAHLLITTDTFYWTVSELPLCLALLFPFSALMERRQRLGPVAAAIAAVICVTIAFGHSLALFAMGFCLGLLWLQVPDRRQAVALSAGCYVSALVAKTLFFRDPYDRGALGGLRNIPKLFPHYLDTAAFRDFLSRCGGDFIWLPVGLLLVAGWYVAGRAFRPALFLLITCLGYLLLVTVCFPDADPTRFYSENLYQPLAFFLVFALVSRPALQLPGRIFVLIPGLIFAGGLTRIIQAKSRYGQRLSWQRGLIRQYANDKAILAESAFSPKQYLLSWSSPYEFWLLSSLETGRAASIVITKNPAEAAGRIGSETKAFLPGFGLYYYAELPQRYFPFVDTTHAYRLVLR